MFIYNQANSFTLPIVYGVVQGSILGFLLFLFYINNVENTTDRTPRLFVDDTCFVSEASSPSQLELRLNHELKKVPS